MASEAPIGIFDSGIGGLTVAHAIARVLPAERLSYFGDTAHMPYGDRSPELVRSWSVRIAEHLLDQGCKAIVIACNSASATAAAAVRDLAGEAVPVIDVISPVVRAVAGQGHARIGVIGTRATIGSGIYGRTLRDALRESGRDGVVEEWARNVEQAVSAANAGVAARLARSEARVANVAARAGRLAEVLAQQRLGS